jgi:hypothetical protein
MNDCNEKLIKQYAVHYGMTVPYKHKVFSNWKDTSEFIKKQLDAGIIVRSVSKELGE